MTVHQVKGEAAVGSNREKTSAQSYASLTHWLIFISVAG
jgi:hypothetical protein